MNNLIPSHTKLYKNSFMPAVKYLKHRAISLAEIAMALVIAAIVIAAIAAMFSSVNNKRSIQKWINEWDKAHMEAVKLATDPAYTTGNVYTYTSGSSRIYYSIQSDSIMVGALLVNIDVCSQLETRENNRQVLETRVVTATNTWTPGIACKDTEYLSEGNLAYFVHKYRR